MSGGGGGGGSHEYVTVLQFTILDLQLLNHG